MMVSKQLWQQMLISGANRVISAKGELTEIDSRFGDADHGITMEKVAKAIIAGANEAEGSIKAMLDDIAMRVMMLNGGSVVPLWNTLLDGMQEACPDGEEIDLKDFKRVFAEGLRELKALSGAKIGNKTMMDALIPAVEAMNEAEGDLREVMEAAARAATAGAEDTKNFIAKFGRAKSYKEQTLGTPDAGAVSMKYFFLGMSEGI